MTEVSIKFLNLASRAKNLRPVTGRESEIRRLVQILLKPKHHHAAIVGEPGVGKSSLVSMLAQAVADQVIPSLPSNIYELDTTPILNLLVSSDSIQTCYHAIRTNLASLPSAIIIIEDIQLLAVNDPIRLEQTVSLMQMIADIPNIRLVVTTTKTAHDKTFRGDYTFGRLLTPLEIEELGQEMIHSILGQAFVDQGVQADTKAISTIVELTGRYNHGRSLPDIGLRLIEDLSVEALFEDKASVTAEDVHQFIAKREKIPVSSLKNKGNSHLATLEDRLNQHVIGQSRSLKTISRSIIKNELGLADAHRPRSSFLLLGPSGVGKTETAKALTSIVYDNPKALVRLDMSEYSESHSAIRLTGSPPGYVGYEEGGQLTGAVQRQPSSLVLLDEIEKAHPKLFDVFLQLLDDGRLTDSSGVTVDFSHTMVLATSNIGSQEIVSAAEQGVDVSSQKFIATTLMPILLKDFRPEFINRFDAILVYRPLILPQLVSLASREISKLEQRLASQRIKLNIPEELIEKLLANDYNPLFGARPVKRLVANHFEMPIAERIISGEMAVGTVIDGSEEWLGNDFSSDTF